jgi:cardiolipin synthase
MLRHLPNMLTGLRLLAAPATAVLLMMAHFEAALGIFAFAGLSDAADGFLAKRFNLTSKLGRFLDPAADKTLLLAAFITLSLIGAVPLWLTLAVLFREAFLMAGILVAVLARAPIEVNPLLIGKTATALQVVYVLMHLVALAFSFDIAMLEPAAAYVVAGFSILSGLGYFVVGLRAMRARS